MYENELSKIEKLLEEKKLKEQAVLQAREDIVRTIDQNFGIKKMIMDSALEIGTGLNGKDGKDGIDGLNGADGLDGKDGINGKDGLNGKDGKQGLPGRNGINGKDGQPGLNGNDGVGIESVKKIDNNLVVTLTNGVIQNVGSFPKSGNGGKYSRSPYEYAQEAGYTGTEDAFYTLLANMGGSGGGAWGGITGTLSDQEDLQEALNAKADTGDIPTALSELTEDTTHRTVTDTEKTTWNAKQAALVSGENIKTVGGVSILGSGDISVSASKTRKNFFIENDFMYNNSQSFSPWFGNAIGSGTIAMVDSDANHPGQLQLSSSATANSGYYILFNPASILISGSESAEYIVKTPSVITSTAKVKLGFQDVFTYVDPTDGAWMNMGGSTLTGKTANNGSVSATGTSYTILANTIYRATIEVNADATLVTFSLYTDNSTTPTWTDTLATNIPTAKGRNVGHGIMATNGGTSAAPLIIVDYMNLKIDRELAR